MDSPHHAVPEITRLTWSDPANQAEAIAIQANFSKLPPERLAGWIYTEKDYYRARNGMPDLDVLQSNMETQRDLGFLRTRINIRDFADLGMVREAAARIR